MIRVMTSLRDEHTDRTKQRIRWALLELLEDESPATISVPKVAAQAGVSLRTVYRYFPTKAELVHSASHWYDERAADVSGETPTDENTDLSGYLKVLWSDFAQNLSGVRAQHSSPAGREIRQIRLTEWRTRVAANVRRRSPDLAEHDVAHVTDLIVALASSSMFLELVDRMGHEPDHAVDMIVGVIDLLARQSSGSTKGDLK